MIERHSIVTLKIANLGFVIAICMAGPALSQQIEYTYTTNDGRLLASNCFQCHGVNGANSKAFDSLAGENDVYKELLEMNQSSGVDREEELMAVHAKAFAKMGGVNGANGPQIEMRQIADFFASQGSGGGGDNDDDDRPITYSLSVAKTNPGYGSISSSPGELSCSTKCTSTSRSYRSGTVVRLTAKASKGRVFTGWSGDCSGAAATCVVTMTSAKSVTAMFEAGSSQPATYSLSLTKTNPSFGSVSGHLYCNARCSETSKSFKTGKTVKLKARAAKNRRFVGWTGDCSGSSSTCEVTMTSAKSVQAVFE